VTAARRCAALLVSAPASGQGKTTVTAALARRARRRGLRVRVFKTGPDFIDPMILERASGAPVYQLDLWMVGEAHCRALLHAAAAQADLILIEGVMGLYDGQPSSADLARHFGIPVLAVIDGSAMAQTFGAIAYGLSRYREPPPFYGVLANGVGSSGHAQMLAASLPSPLRFAGALPRDAAFAIPERHLGLLQAEEIAGLDGHLDAAAAALGDAADLADLAPVEFPVARDYTPPPRLLDGVNIAVARDAAFSFLYRANLDLLEAMGACLRFFSPLADAELPSADAVYLPGGYPELHAQRFAENAAMHRALRTHCAAGRPLLAECGGMMALFDALVDRDGRRHAMAAVLSGETAMQPRLQALALQAVDLGDGELRGHSFHYSRLSTPLTPVRRGRDPSGAEREAVYRDGRVTASYIHFYFPSNPCAAARLFLP
jgi:cobyrinic acid a,c-diamide synthase